MIKGGADDTTATCILGCVLGRPSFLGLPSGGLMETLESFEWVCVVDEEEVGTAGVSCVSIRFCEGSDSVEEREKMRSSAVPRALIL